MQRTQRFFRHMALGFLALAASAAHAARVPTYTITEIALPQASWIEVTAVNNRGDVAGWFRGPVPGLTFEAEHAFLWQNGSARDLGVPPGANNSRINAMNDKGLLVGSSPGLNAYTWQDGTWNDLGFRGDALSVNRSGAIAGTYTTATNGNARGFLFANGVFWDIGGSSIMASANSVNDKNRVVGWREMPDGSRQAFVWSAGTLTDAGTLGGPSSWLNSINSHGVAVGASFDRDFGLAAAKWDGDLSRLFNLPGTHVANAINDRGAAVGVIDSGAFLYDDGQLTRLDQLPPVLADGWSALTPTAINERGWIVGRGLRNGARRGFILVTR
jgi:probable HAF family extracellular repeat protein